MAGVSPAAITKAISNKLAEACQGKRIDASHPDAQKYLEARNQPQRKASQKKQRTAQTERKKAAAQKPKAKPAPKSDKEKPATKKRVVRGAEAASQSRKMGPPPKSIAFVPEDIWAMSEMPFCEIAIEFGSDSRFKDWANGLKTLEEIEDKRLKNAKAKGELVSRELMKQKFYDPVEEFHQKLLADAPGRIARGAINMVKAEEECVEVEKFIRNEISIFLKQMKRKLKK